MNIHRFINLSLIVIGGLIAFYAEPENNEDIYILIAGICALMIGLYRLSRGISSTLNNDNDCDNQDSIQ